ncbi:MDR family MFS transporter [Hwanghaeella grinnelliae]|nr:MDR family MFS transporter [Hwanghaeella grinnelliae]
MPQEEAAPNRALVLVTLTFVTMLYAMTVTIANVSLPQMQGALSATTDQIALVVTFNIVATAIVTPMTGWLTGRFGRRNTMIWGVGGFTIASFLCGAAPNLETLILFRAAQGAFGAPLVPLSQAILLETYPKKDHGFATSIYGTGVVLGPVIAPTLGGYLSELLSWRWVFFMIIPFGVIAFTGVITLIKSRSDRPSTKLDWTGFISLSIAVAAAQLMLDRGERNDWFNSTEIIAIAGLSCLALYFFVAHTLTAKPGTAFLNIAILKDRNYVLGLLIVFVFGMLNFTPMTLLPPLLQTVQDYPDSIIGWLLGARGIGTLVAFAMMVYLSKLDPRPILITGFLIQGLAGFAMANFDVNVTTFDVAWTSCLQGFGVGLIWVPVTLITFSTMDPKLLPEGMAIFHLLRNFGSSVFISISFAVVIRTGKTNYSEMVEQISPFNERLGMPFVAGRWSFDSTEGLAAISGEVGRQAVMVGYVNAFYLFSLACVCVIPFVFLVRMKRASR